MKVVKNMLCRNAGMLYIQIDVVAVEPGSSLSMTVSTPQSEDSPGNFFMLGTESHKGSLTKKYVVCLPEFQVEQTVTISELSPTGMLLTEASVKVFPKLAALESKANYLLHHDDAYLIRGAEEEHFDKKMKFHVVGLLISPTRWVLRGRIQVPDTGIKVIELKVLDRNGNPISGPIKLKGLTCSPDFPGDSDPYPTFAFSVDIPPESKSICLLGSSPENPSVDSFYVAYESQLRQLHDAFIDTTKSAGSDIAYPQWLKEHCADAATLARQQKVKFAQDVKFSIVVPLYNSPLTEFREMVESVLAQSYKNWELILVNSTPDNADLSKLVGEFSAQDNRIKPMTLEKNLGIAKNTNEGIKAAAGDYVCFLDHDDFIEPDILFEYAAAIETNPDIKLLYCDEDVFEYGEFTRAHLKPDFSIDHLRCNNYICHMLTIERKLLLEAGMVPLDYDGAQDHALTLRIAEMTDQIHHVPKILYHWRVVESSVAANPETKPYAGPNGVRAVQNHLDRLGVPAYVEEYGKEIPFTYRVHYVPPNDARVSIIIPSHNGLEVLEKCIESVLASKNSVPYEIVLVENNSSDPALFDYYERITTNQKGISIKVVVWQGEGFNFSALVNYGVKNSTGSHILLLNNDTEVIHDFWLDELVGMASRDEVGAVGARLMYPDKTYQHTGLAVIGDGVSMLLQNVPAEMGDAHSWCYFYYEQLTRNVSAITGACLMVRRSLFEELDGFDETLAVAFNDVDFCLKLLEKGYINVYTPNATLVHHESYSRREDSRTTHGVVFTEIEHKRRFLEELHRFQLKWLDFYAKGDPFHNPNFAKYGIGNQYYKLEGFDRMF